MPTIVKGGTRRYNGKRESNDLERKKRQRIYQNPLWKRLRDAHLMEHPLCEVCELEGKVTLAEDCHHIISFTTGRNELEMKTLAFDPNNLVAVCKQCHNRLHHQDLKGCKSLEDVQQRIDAQNVSLSERNNQ